MAASSENSENNRRIKNTATAPTRVFNPQGLFASDDWMLPTLDNSTVVAWRSTAINTPTTIKGGSTIWDTIVYSATNSNTPLDVKNLLNIGDNTPGSGHATLLYQGISAAPKVKGNPTAGALGLIVDSAAKAAIHIGSGDSLSVGQKGVGGDISLGWKGQRGNGYSLIMDDGAILSGAGYLGGVADKGAATSAHNNSSTQGNSRTGAISAGNNVTITVDGDFAAIGDPNNAMVSDVFGNDAHLNIGGTLGVFLRATMNMGDRAHIKVAGAKGSGFFVGSGGNFLAGKDFNIEVNGGMGAGYTGSIISIGDGAEILLNDKDIGVLGAEASGQVTIGNNANITAAMISVGWAQDPDTAAPRSAFGAGAFLTIGDGATIDLAADLAANPNIPLKIAQSGYLTIDGVNDGAIIGANVNFSGVGISVGNFAKEFYFPDNLPTGLAGETSAYFEAGTGDILRIGSGANISLSDGLIVDGNNDTLIFSGGGSNQFIADYISVGNFSRTFTVIPEVPGIIAPTKTVFSAGYNNLLSMGDDFNIVLTDGGFVQNGNDDQTIFGQNVSITAQSMYMGYDSASPPASIVAGSLQKMTIGNGAKINLDKGFFINGSYDSATFGDRAIVNAGMISIGMGANTGVPIPSGESLFFGSNAQVNLASGLILDGNTTTMSFGLGGHLNATGGINFQGALASLSMASGGTISTVGGNVTLGNNTDKLVMGDGATLDTGNGAINLNGSNNSATFGDRAIVNAGMISIGMGANTGGAIPSNEKMLFGNSAQVNLASGLILDGSITTMSFGLVGHLNATGGINFQGVSAGLSMASGGTISTVGGNVTLGNNNDMLVMGDGATLDTGNGAINLNGSHDGVVMGIGATLDTGNGAINLNNTQGIVVSVGGKGSFNVGAWNFNSNNQSVVLGDGAQGNLGNIIMSATSDVFSMGHASGLQFNSAILGGNGDKLVGGGQISGDVLSLTNGAVFSMQAGADVTLNSIIMNNNGGGVVSIYVGPGAVLQADALQLSNVAVNKPVIQINGGTVIVGNNPPITESNSNLSQDITVNFNKIANGIYHYEGDIQDASGLLTIRNFVSTDELIFDSSKPYDQSGFSVDVSGNQLSVTYKDPDGTLENIATFDYTGVTSGLYVSVVPGSVGGSTEIIITKCFLKGTHMKTPEGERMVETLSEGDELIVLEDGQEVAKRIAWVGTMDVNVNNYNNKETLYPVRIKAHAFGLNQPHRDLLVTPEHTIYINGKLIPARMLVNDRSIVIDKSFSEFTVYHVAMDKHSIVLSENLPTESYLNTGDLYKFQEGVVTLHLELNENFKHENWEKDAAAPLVVDHEKVELVWKRLNRRATQLGYAEIVRPAMTRDPALRLITHKGEMLEPIDVKNNIYSFYVSAHTRVVALYSRAEQPAKVLGSFWDDRRNLGVAVAKLTLFSDKVTSVLPREMPQISGWHPVEQGQKGRWTQGLATLPLEISEAADKVRLLQVEIADTAYYFLDDKSMWEKIA